MVNKATPTQKRNFERSLRQVRMKLKTINKLVTNEKKIFREGSDKYGPTVGLNKISDDLDEIVLFLRGFK